MKHGKLGELGQLGHITTTEASGSTAPPPPPPPPPSVGVDQYMWDDYPVGLYYGMTPMTVTADYRDDSGNHSSYVIRILRRPYGAAEIGHIFADREEIAGFTYDDFSVTDQNGIAHLVVTPQGSVTGTVTAYIARTDSFNF